MADADKNAGRDGTIARLGAKVRTYVQRAKSAETELAALKAAKAADDAELAKFRAADDVPAAVKRADELAAKLREITHRKAFDAAAAKAGVKPGAIEALYKLSGYTPAADEPDEAAIGRAIKAQRATSDFLFADAATLEQGDELAPATIPIGPRLSADGRLEAGPRIEAGPGAGRGKPVAAPPRKYTTEQLSDPMFVARNYDEVVRQARESVANSNPGA